MATLGKLPVRGFKAGSPSAVVTRGFHAPGGVVPPVGPTNSTCATAIDVTHLTPYSITLDTTNAATDLTVHPTCHGNADGRCAVWWKITNNTSAYQLAIVQTSATYYQCISAWSGSCGSLTQVACSNSSFGADPDYYFDFAMIPQQTYWILVLSDDSVYGGTLTFGVTTFQANTRTLIANPISGRDFDQYLQAYSGSSGVLQALDTTYQSPTNTFRALVRRPSDGYILSAATGGGLFQSTIFTISPSMGLLFRTLVNAPDTVPALGWEPRVLCVDAAGYLYLLWINAQAGLGYHCLDKRSAVTFELIQQWNNFDPGGFTGGNMQGGAVSPDGKKFYYSWADFGQANSNQVKVLNLVTGVPSVFATYGTWDADTHTGFTTYYHNFRTDDTGNVYVAMYYSPGGFPATSSRLLRYTPAGVLNLDFQLATGDGTSASAVQPASFVITPDKASVWVIFIHGLLNKYQLSSGAIILSADSGDIGFINDLILQGSPEIPGLDKACVINFPLE